MEYQLITSTLLLALMIPFSKGLLFGLKKEVPVKKCSPLELKACSQLGYNETQHSPHLYLSSRRSEVFEYFGLLRLTKCSEDLLFFICMMYQPICFADYDKAIPPCRSVCQNVRDGCISIITRYGFRWPEELDCDKLPDHQSGVCIKPSAIIKNEIYVQERKPSENSVSGETQSTSSCKKCPKPVSLKKFRYFKRADFAIQGRFFKRSTQADGKTALSLKISNVYKIGKVGISTSGIAELWAASSCFCPRLELDKKYVILGYENVKENKLVYDERIVAEISTPFFERRIMKYALKYEQRLQKRRAKKWRRLSKTKKR